MDTQNSNPEAINQDIASTPEGQITEAFSLEMIKEDSVIDTSSNLSKESFTSLLRLFDDHYHNGMSLISDKIYDELIFIYESKYGMYNFVGTSPSHNKVLLPYYLSSLRKPKNEKELNSWVAKYPPPYVIQDKIDGLTLLLVSETVKNRRVLKLYTRGHGVEGMDVSHLLEYITLPDVTSDITIRGEIVMTKDVFINLNTD